MAHVGEEFALCPVRGLRAFLCSQQPGIRELLSSNVLRQADYSRRLSYWVRNRESSGVKLTDGAVRPHNAIFHIYSLTMETVLKNGPDSFPVCHVDRIHPGSGIFIERLARSPPHLVISRADIRYRHWVETHREKNLGNVLSQLT